MKFRARTMLVAIFFAKPALAGGHLGPQLSGALATAILVLWAFFAVCAFVPTVRALVIALVRRRSVQTAVEQNVGEGRLAGAAEVDPPTDELPPP